MEISGNNTSAHANSTGFNSSDGGGDSGSRVDTAVGDIQNRLDESGLFDEVTHNDLREISNTLSQLSPEETRDAISRLSDSNLGKWTDEIASNGWFGTGGLDAGERTALFNDLASKLEPEQMARVYNASGDNGIRTELIEALNQQWKTAGIDTAAENRLAALPAGTNRTELQTALSESRQLQDHTLMARLSSDVYLSYTESLTASLSANRLPQGVTRMSPGELQAELGIKQEQLVDNESGFHAAVYKVQQQGNASYIVAFRGTEGSIKAGLQNFMLDTNKKEGRDWGTNFESLSTLTDQEKMAADLVEAVVKKAGKDNITVTGHSLGGGLSNYAALLHGVPSVAFNAKGITLPEIAEINKELQRGETLDQRAQRLVTNYQVDGEILTGLQNGTAGIHDTARFLTKLPGISMQDRVAAWTVAVGTAPVRTAPGIAIETPAIRPDGKEGNMLLEAAEKLAILLTTPGPVAYVMAGRIDISGPLDRHGMDYVLRGMEHMNKEASEQLLKSLFNSFTPATSDSALQNRLNYIAP